MEIEDQPLFSFEEISSTLSDFLIREGLQLAAMDGWLLIFRTRFDVYKSSEPHRTMELLFELKTGRYLTRVWHSTIDRGMVISCPELEGVIVNTFQGTVPCAGVPAKSHNPAAVTVVTVPFKRTIATDCLLSVRPTPEQRLQGGVMRCASCKLASDVTPRAPAMHVVPKVEVNVKAEEMASDGEDQFGFDDDYRDDEGANAAFDDDELPEEGSFAAGAMPPVRPVFIQRKPRQPPKPKTLTIQECKYCDFETASANGLRKHERLDHMAGVTHCVYCAEQSKDIPALIAHTETVHPHITSLSCPYCQEELKMRPEFEPHFKACVQRSHEDVRYRRLPESQRPIKCLECGKKCNTWILLKVHYKRHIGKQDLFCDQCDFKTYSEFALQGHKQLHKRLNGETQVSLVCELCGKNYNHAYSLKSHMEYVHSNKSDDITCEQCGKHFNRLKMYQRHCNRDHSDDPRYACKVCGKRFHAMTRAQRCEAQHNGVFPFNCEVCGKGVRRKRSLIEHMRIHTGERPFQCNMCEYSAKSASALYIHRRHVHKIVLSGPGQELKEEEEPQM